ncbi:acetyl-CoA C-acyltransferase [Spongiactinospora sp. TRM90649]|uniref:thiolase family protein n=1 Tax=Spongiactinospora sp. TRM90649 TaxID=3031114 RepID=UPI0023F932EB|nr:acetyl-CoA C-acyltransferase [Spongiactinospora sp. TRM90649]MDF5752157.1 acetyl-CoA C-acyltransferase [Spongiactinospora sp. TRM90649]
MTNAVIVDVVRTASGRGKPGGALSGIHPADLLGRVLRALVDRHAVDPELVDDVIVGCVSQVGDQSANVARSAVLAAGFPETVPATTIDRQCGSSQQALHFAAQGIMAGAYDVVIAGGVESMSRVPMGASTQGGAPFAPVSARYDGRLVPQGIAAELLAARWRLDRQALDEYSAESHRRAAACAAGGAYDDEIVPIEVTTASGERTTHTRDETIRPDTTPETLGGLRASFVDPDAKRRFPEIDWRITPGNSSPLTDGASAALLMSEERARRLGLTPRARLHAFAVAGSDPVLMLTGIIPATRKILDRARLRIADIDAYEVNEAFAPVPLLWQAEFDADPARLNPHGGAIALGHPLGASGTRLLATLVNRLDGTRGRYGLQVMCEGGGMANATIIERL